MNEPKIINSAVIYLRVSTEEQVDNFSLDTQLEICTKEAERRGIQINKTFREEGKSAKTITGRPVLIEMLEYCRKNKKSVDARYHDDNQCQGLLLFHILKGNEPR